VVVLGPTGRNFAAGMSGGIAYVLDEAGEFEARCNLAMVDLEPIKPEAMPDDPNWLADVTRYDAPRLKRLIERHVNYTNSARARQILAEWDAMLPRFVKVFPRDYRRALGELAKLGHAPGPQNGAQNGAAHGTEHRNGKRNGNGRARING